MKLIQCNGEILTELGPVIYALRATTAPIKLHGLRVLTDDAAREVLREVHAGGNVERAEEDEG